jgi:hypothetical protein
MRFVPLAAFQDRIPMAVAIGAVERGFRDLTGVGVQDAAIAETVVEALGL